MTSVSASWLPLTLAVPASISFGKIAGHDLGKGPERELDGRIDFLRHVLSHFRHTATHVKCLGFFLVGEFDLNDSVHLRALDRVDVDL